MLVVECGLEGLKGVACESFSGCMRNCVYLDTGWHGDVEVTQHMLGVLILGRLPQERKEPRCLLIAVSNLIDTQRQRK